MPLGLRSLETSASPWFPNSQRPSCYVLADGESPQVATEAIINYNLYGGMNYLFNLIHFACFPHIPTMPSYISTKFLLLFILQYVSSASLRICTLKLLHKLITEQTLHNCIKFSVTQSLDYCFSKIVESQSKLM